MRLALLMGVVVTAIAASSDALAYPQWQFSTGATRCNQCHYAPAGGGLLTDYGRDASGEELSTVQGNGAFLHGLMELPEFLKLGLDARLATIAHDNGGPDGPQRAFFPMQFDVYARAAFGSFAFQGIAGVRGQVRRTDAPIPDSNFAPGNESRFVSREHWFIWQPAARGLYARAGRFYAPFGLRLAEHITYVRRDLGFNILQETYNLSAGFLDNDWEGHVTVFGPDFLQGGNQEAGAAGYVEKRVFDERAAVALQAKYANDKGASRLVGGAVGKLFVAPAGLLFMTELNYVQVMPDDAKGTGQFVGLAGASWLPPVKGLLTTFWVERLQSSVQTLDTAVHAVTGLASFFPYPHFELQFVGRLQNADGGTTFKTFLAQLHYYL